MNINQIIIKYINTNKGVLIDVRSNGAFKQKHIPLSKNIPYSKLESLDLPKETIIFLCCDLGIKSKEAVKVLKNKGFKNVYSLGSIKNYSGQFEMSI